MVVGQNQNVPEKLENFQLVVDQDEEVRNQNGKVREQQEDVIVERTDNGLYTRSFTKT